MPNGGMDRSDALEILKLAVEDIERIKQQQWRDFYAALLLQAGLLVLFKDHLGLRWLFIVLSLVSAFLGGLLIGTTQRSLERKFRPRLNRALQFLGNEFTEVWGGSYEPGELGSRNAYPNICLFVLGLGSAVTILIILKYPPAVF
jgi:hypothetical protein